MFGGDIPDEVLEKAGDDGELRKIECIIQSMTRQERNDPEIFIVEGKRGGGSAAAAKLSRRKKRQPKPTDYSNLAGDDFVQSRIKRVSTGSGTKRDEVEGLIGRFMVMRGMFGMLGDLMGGGGGGLMSKLPGMGKLKQMNALRKMAKDPDAMQAMMSGQMPAGMPALPGMGGMPGMPGGGGMPPGMDMASLMGMPGAPKAPTRAQKQAAKDKRKKQKKARKKNRKR